MNREILFRGKRKDNGEWGYGYYSVDRIRKVNRFYVAPIIWQTVEDGGGGAEITPETVGQYTGIIDALGTKIFEGDIVEFEDRAVDSDEIFITRGVVAFADGQFYITNRLTVEMEDLVFMGKLDGEVVGNMYDNPELMEG